MRKLWLLWLLLGLSVMAQEKVADYQEQADALVEKAQTQTLGWQRLESLVTKFPHRLSGSAPLERCIDWIASEMKKDGFDRVTTEEVQVPHWRRGREELVILDPLKSRKLEVTALGGSVSTPAEGLEAEVIVVSSYQELEQRQSEAKGKIVVFDVPFTRYGETVGYRISGASRAADAGAVAALLRSVTPNSLATVHTGVMAYDEESGKVPFAAISPEAAAHFHRLEEAGIPTRARLVLETFEEKDALSRNVVAEIRGREFPEQIVLVGGHIDGWDIGEGAQDDAGGCLMSWEAVRLIKALGLRPRRTLRVVLWTNEENGLRGAKAYHSLHRPELENHVLAIESDYGTFHPTGFGFSGKEKARRVLQNVVDLMSHSVGPMSVKSPGGGADIGPLMRDGVPGAGLTHNSDRYFWYHHSPADTLEAINPDDFRNCVATLAVTLFVVADLPERLPFGQAED